MNKYKEQLEILKKFVSEDGSCDEEVLLNAIKSLEELIENYQICKNEMCLLCGKYKNEHLGACKGCKFYE